MPCPDHTATIAAYHRRTGHSARGYARGPDTLDWDAQPQPWRSWAGCARLPLPLVSDALTAPYGALTGEAPVAAAPLGLPAIAALLELSFGLSAWKQAGPDRWGLRCNPSSGNLHPTEVYLLANGVPGLADGVHHYDSRGHALEHRCDTGCGGGQLWIGLSSVLWREAWKYGERAFRYCQLDIGHALGALQAAASLLGWRVSLPGVMHSADVARLIGTDREADFAGVEREEAEVMLVVETSPTALGIADAPVPAAGARWHGKASLLDPHPMFRWPVIEEVASASRGTIAGKSILMGRPTPAFAAPLAPGAATIIGRRSAQRYDRNHTLPIEQFARMIDASRPVVGSELGLIAFVHAVEGLAPGIYAMPCPGMEEGLKAALDPGFHWASVAALPPEVPLRQLVAADCRKLLRALACHQAIAADGCVTFCLLSDFAPLIERNPAAYRSQHWQAGLLGHRLYLEAEAHGLSGTGIGCFLDEDVHRLLGIADGRWQALYLFTVGKGLADSRIQTSPAYGARGRSEAPIAP
jgi:nitroreductase